MHPTLLSASDLQQYKALMLHAYGHAADAFTSTADERSRETDDWWRHRIANPNETTFSFGAFDNQQMIATVAIEYSLKPKTKHKALIVGMYVLSAWRGKGIARSLMLTAIDHAKSRSGVSVLQLNVTHGNEPALNLYQSLGFQQFGLEPMAILTPNGYRSKLHMWQQLGGDQNAA